MTTVPEVEKQTNPILLFNDECAVCRRIGNWVKKSAVNKSLGLSRTAPPVYKGNHDPRVRLKAFLTLHGIQAHA